MANWDLLVAIAVILIIALIVAAKVTGQTIMELIGDIRDFFTDKKEDTVEMATQIYE
jgi:hypothetical protein